MTFENRKTSSARSNAVALLPVQTGLRTSAPRTPDCLNFREIPRRQLTLSVKLKVCVVVPLLAVTVMI